MKNRCPICDSELKKSSSICRKIKVDHYQSFSVGHNLIECDVCEYSGGDEHDIDNQIEVARKESNLQTLKMLIDEISNMGQKASFIERSFNLPAKTLNRWKHQGGSAAALALMKLIKTFDWLPKVADNGYDPQYARNECCQQAAIQFNKIRKSIEVENMVIRASIISADGKFNISAAISDLEQGRHSNIESPSDDSITGNLAMENSRVLAY